MKQEYYLPINSTSLAHYVSSAIIKSARMFTNRPNDLQSIDSDYLILSKTKYVNETNCSVKLVLNEEDIKNIISTDNEQIYLCKTPLPISKITSIYFKNNEQNGNTIYNINKTTAFIPSEWVKVEKEDEVSIDISALVKDKYKYTDTIEQQIKNFDHYLGGVAFARYSTDGKHMENFLSIFSYFNSCVEKQYCEQGGKINRDYDTLFNEKHEPRKKLYSLVYGDIDAKDAEREAKSEGITLNKTPSGNYSLDSLDSSSDIYALTILSLYGKGSTKTKSLDNFLSDLRSGRLDDREEERLSLLLGINNGYRDLRNEYKIPEIGIDKNVKLKMNSEFDYYLAESIFNYSFNGSTKSDKLDFSWSNIKNTGSSRNFDYEVYRIVDTEIEGSEKTIIGRLREWIAEDKMSKVVEFIKKELDYKEQIISDLNDTNKQLKESGALQKASLSKKTEENKELQAQNDDFKTAKDRLEKEAVELKSKLEELEKSNQGLEVKIKTLEDEKNQISASLGAKEKENEKLCIQNDVLETAKNKLEKEAVELKSKLEEIEKSNQGLEVKIKTLEDEKNQISASLGAKEKENEKLCIQNDVLETAKNKLEKEAVELKSKLEEIEKSNQKLDTKTKKTQTTKKKQSGEKLNADNLFANRNDK